MSPKDVTTVEAEATYDEIALQSYSLWETPEEDWSRAEQEIRGERAQSAETAESLRVKAESASA